MSKRTKHPQHVIDQAVRRHLAGESVVSLAKEYNVSKPGFYLWVQKHKSALLTTEMQAGMSPKAKSDSEKLLMQMKIDNLTRENRKLRDKMVDMMLKQDA